MNIVNAFWEKRNLNLETIEVVIDANDSWSDIEKNLQDVQAEYIVIKLSSLNVGACHLLSKMGYTFIEAMTHNIYNMNSPLIHFQKESRLDTIKLFPMMESDMAAMFIQISDGLFHTDRISLDPYFTPLLANQRYIGWIQDEIKRGAEFYSFKQGGVALGFLCVKKVDEYTYQCVFYGIYSEFQGKGLAVDLLNDLMLMLKERSCKAVLIDVSLNNLSSLKSCCHSGFQLTGIDYIFVKHCLDAIVYHDQRMSQ